MLLKRGLLSRPVFLLFFRKGEEVQRSVRNKFSSAISSVKDDISVANNDLLSSVDRKFSVFC